MNLFKANAPSLFVRGYKQGQHAGWRYVLRTQTTKSGTHLSHKRRLLYLSLHDNHVKNSSFTMHCCTVAHGTSRLKKPYDLTP